MTEFTPIARHTQGHVVSDTWEDLSLLFATWLGVQRSRFRPEPKPWLTTNCRHYPRTWIGCLWRLESSDNGVLGLVLSSNLKPTNPLPLLQTTYTERVSLTLTRAILLALLAFGSKHIPQFQNIPFGQCYHRAFLLANAITKHFRLVNALYSSNASDTCGIAEKTRGLLLCYIWPSLLLSKDSSQTRASSLETRSKTFFEYAFWILTFKHW
jgi:hypothetical protein